jgi:hypothetical protein
MTASCGNGAFDKDAGSLKERGQPSQSESESIDPKRGLRDLTRRRGDAEDTPKADSPGGGAAFTRWVITCCYDFMGILRASAPPREPIAGF